MMVPPGEPENTLLRDEEAELCLDLGATLAETRERLLSYLYRRLGDREVAADLTQEALLRLLKYRESTEIENPPALLHRIAYHLLLEYRRTQHRRRADFHVSLEDVAPLHGHQPPVESIVAAQQTMERLFTQTLATLPERCRLAFMLNRFDGLSYPQVAARMGISVKMVEKHIAHALVACRLAAPDRDV